MVVDCGVGTDLPKLFEPPSSEERPDVTSVWYRAAFRFQGGNAFTGVWGRCAMWAR